MCVCVCVCVRERERERERQRETEIETGRQRRGVSKFLSDRKERQGTRSCPAFYFSFHKDYLVQPILQMRKQR